MATSTEVLVGLDDSESAVAALQWAADYARAAGLPLRAMYVYTDIYPSAAWGPGYISVPIHATVDELEQMSVQRIFSSIQPEVGWRLEFVRGAAGPELVRQADHADLLAIGTREHTGLDRLVVGSVSHYCFSHAGCPVVAVPASPGTHARGDDADHALAASES